MPKTNGTLDSLSHSLCTLLPATRHVDPSILLPKISSHGYRRYHWTVGLAVVFLALQRLGSK